jgi:hypothetical protein
MARPQPELAERRRGLIQERRRRARERRLREALGEGPGEEREVEGHAGGVARPRQHARGAVEPERRARAVELPARPDGPRLLPGGTVA